MFAKPVVEVATQADLEALMLLRTQQGWQRGSELLQAIHLWDGGRIFIVRQGSLDPGSSDPLAPVATTSAIAAPSVGVVGNVIVRSDYRRHGLGRMVMEATLDWMRSGGVEAAYLDATTEGRPLYRRLGFVDRELSWYGEADISHMDVDALEKLARGATASYRGRDDLDRLAHLDRQAFGGDRIGLLRVLASMPHHWLYVADGPDGAPSGYALVRLLEAPYRGIRVGPWVATGPDVAAALLAAILRERLWRSLPDLAHTHDLQVFISVPGTNRDAMALLSGVGAELHEDDLIMRLDMPGEGGKPRASAGHPEWLYGWIAPMVF